MLVEENFAQDFENLRVYILARELSLYLFERSKRFPKEERYAVTSQIRRSSRSIGAQIAEGWGRRRYPRHFISKMTDADSEQLETKHWISIAMDAKYLTESEAKTFRERCVTISKMLYGMIAKADLFCH